ncbi:hypothetical protein GF319_02420 [Candidatus Bathyarchaeota archaeon]|nr:hypothetical protein [Candidatus Bathyarchaeota archaeon]
MSFTIDNIEVPKGEIHRGFLKVAEGSTHNIELPFIVINGSGEGPTLTVLSGVHALETAPIEAVLRLAEDINPINVSGTLLLVPVVNTEGFHSRKPYNNQLDHLNQNKVFPGDPESSITKRVAHKVFTHFVSKSDYLVDCHSADLGEDVKRGMFIYETENKDLAEQMITMARCFDCDFIETTSISGNTGEAANLLNIPCIMTESGTPYPIRDEDVIYHFNGIKNLMTHLGMIKGKAKIGDQPVNPKTERIWAKTGGIWRRRVEAGQKVEKGDVLGGVSDLTGQTKQSVTAPFSGSVTFLRIHYSVNEGDTLLWLTEI